MLKVANNGGSSRACGGDHRHYRLLGVETRTLAKQAHSLYREIGTGYALALLRFDFLSLGDALASADKKIK